MAAEPPLVQVHQHPPSHSRSLPPSSSVVIHQSPPSSKSPIDFSPPLIAMVVVAAAAFLFITYSRLISRHLFPPFLRLVRRRRFLPSSDLGSPPHPAVPYQSSDGFYVYSPYGLDESTIKNIPLTVYNNNFGNPKQQQQQQQVGYIELDNNGLHDCAVCLLDFQEGDCIRTLPPCCHPFHVDCIDMWLRSHATCPLCRTGVFLSDSPLLSPPLMAARIRPSVFLEPLQDQVFSPTVIRSEDHPSNRRQLDFLLKRSYSFGFDDRSYPSSDRLAATTPHQRRSFFWTKRPSFKSFRRRRRVLSESSRRMKASPTPLFGTSRMRLGDPEALISPDRYVRTIIQDGIKQHTWRV